MTSMTPVRNNTPRINRACRVRKAMVRKGRRGGDVFMGEAGQ